MADDILSQEEVDALLRGVTGESEETGAEEAGGGVRSYDIGRQERIVRGRMPTLEIINERFARNFRIGLFNLIRRSAEISVGPVTVIKYSEFVRNLVVPTNLNMVHMNPLRGTALFVLDPNLVFLVVDNLFGGDGRYHMRVEGRDFTPTEQRIIKKILEVIFEEMRKAWETIYPVQFEFVRSEMNTQFANIATPTEVVVVSTFNIELGSGGGDFHVCVPYSMIEPIRDQLTSTMQADRAEADERWISQMKLQVQDAEVELVANLGQTSVTLGQIVDLKVGDVISLDVPEAVIAQVDGVPLFKCHYGQKSGQLALKVDQVLQGQEQMSHAGSKMSEDAQKQDDISADDWAAALAEQETSAPAAGGGDDDWAAALAEQEVADKAMAATGDAPAPQKAQIFPNLTPDAAQPAANNLDLILDIPVQLNVELGRTKIAIRNLLQLAQGSVVELDGLAGQPMDVLVNGCLIAQGEVVVVNDKFGIRLTDIISPAERLRRLNR